MHYSYFDSKIIVLLRWWSLMEIALFSAFQHKCYLWKWNYGGCIWCWKIWKELRLLLGKWHSWIFPAPPPFLLPQYFQFIISQTAAKCLFQTQYFKKNGEGVWLFLFLCLFLFLKKCCGKEFKIFQHLEKIFNNLSI